MTNLSTADTASDALVKLALMVDVAGEPALSEGDLEALVSASQRATVWQPNTFYAYGDRVIPTTPQGGWYKCFIPGVSSAAEPLWNTIVPLLDPYSAGPYGLNGYAQNATLMGYPVADGSVSWRNDGRAAGLYDVRSAANAAWNLKAARAAALVDVSLAQDRFSWSQVQKQCLEMARKFVPVGFV